MSLRKLLLLVALSGCGPGVDELHVGLVDQRLLLDPLADQASSTPRSRSATDTWQVGAGIHDITGPVVGVTMMGYVKFDQKTAGIHTRLRSRAFVIIDPRSGRRIVLHTADLINIPDAVHRSVLEKLRAEFGQLYTEENVLLSATHTHSGPGGLGSDRLYNVATLGMSQQNFDTIVGGIVESIRKAHRNVAPATIQLAQGSVRGASRNRSPDAYSENPSAERAQFPDQVDLAMHQLNFVGLNGEPLGFMNWFPIHTTSVQKTNRLISSDNKGYATRIVEREHGVDTSAAKTFVAAFANGNAGDVSPNIAGDITGDGNWDCPLKESFACNREAGESQARVALDLEKSGGDTISGDLDMRFKWVAMSEQIIEADLAQGTRGARTCPGALGLSMLAGTADGRGIGEEGQTCEGLGPFFERLMCRGERDVCQGAKPVALHLARNPAQPWSPQILPAQILRIGSVALVSLPGEFTTMSGRRIRDTVARELAPAGVRTVILAGYANSYAGYVATREEYQLQRYEAASTHFGEWTETAWRQNFRGLARAMRDAQTVERGTAPPDLRDLPRRIDPTPAVDVIPLRAEFGQFTTQPATTITPGQQIRATWYSGHPNRNLRLQDSWFLIQRRVGAAWETVARDEDVETKLHWELRGTPSSTFTLVWEIPEKAAPGDYRIVVKGTSRTLARGASDFARNSRTFSLRARP